MHSGDFFIPSTYTNENNQSYPCYLISRKCCGMVANKITGIPQTYSEALRQLADAVQEKEKIEKENYSSYLK